MNEHFETYVNAVRRAHNARNAAEKHALIQALAAQVFEDEKKLVEAARK